jgi:Uma2 family endonuclease
MAAPTVPLVTTEELLAMPENGMDRWLIRGELREKPMTYRNRTHSGIEAQITFLLKLWLSKQPKPRGSVHSGEAGCRLHRNPDSTVGIDVVYISAELAANSPTDTTIIDGVPILAVEILSPSDKEEEINEKVDEYLRAGVRQVWLVDPHLQTVQVLRSGAEPELFNKRQEMAGEPDLPGFRVKVAEIFEF